MTDSIGGTLSGYTRLCAQCDELLIAPIWSEHVTDSSIRHLWSCEACGYEFETTVYLSLEQRVQAGGDGSALLERG
jgi:hypothetical protein